jgi:cytochrome c553
VRGGSGHLDPLRTLFLEQQENSNPMNRQFNFTRPDRTWIYSICKAALCATGLYLACLPAFAADPANGKVLSRQCSVCHGKNGVANDPEVPNLAAQSSFYLEKSLNAFRSGLREDRRMTLIAQNLKDSDIKDLAAWYSSFTIEVSVPE